MNIQPKMAVALAWGGFVLWWVASMFLALILGRSLYRIIGAAGWREQLEGYPSLLGPLILFWLTCGVGYALYAILNRLFRVVSRDGDLGAWFVKINRETIWRE